MMAATVPRTATAIPGDGRCHMNQRANASPRIRHAKNTLGCNLILRNLIAASWICPRTVDMLGVVYQMRNYSCQWLKSSSPFWSGEMGTMLGIHTNPQPLNPGG